MDFNIPGHNLHNDDLITPIPVFQFIPGVIINRNSGKYFPVQTRFK